MIKYMNPEIICKHWCKENQMRFLLAWQDIIEDAYDEYHSKGKTITMEVANQIAFNKLIIEQKVFKLLEK